MRKRTKTTDAVLKDIFDPLHRAEESAEHPLSTWPRPVPASNRLETFSPGPEKAPLETNEGFENTLDEVREESLLFRAEPEEEAAIESEETESSETPAEVVEEVSVVPSVPVEVSAPAAEAVAAPLPAVEIKKAAPRHHQIVKVSVFLVFAGLSAMLGYILYAQNQGIEQKKAVLKSAVAAQNPAAAWLAAVPHQGVTFKNFTAKNRKLMVKGTVSDQGALVKFVNAMNRTASFRNAKITSMRETQGTLFRKNYEFQIYADIAAPK